MEGLYRFMTGVVDFPDRWAMTLYFSGCNMSCDFCYNKHVLTEEPNYTAEEIVAEFLALKAITPDLSVVFSGGEPSCNQSAKVLEEYFSSRSILKALHTNGLQILEGEWDSVVVSLKPDATTEYLETLKKSLDYYSSSARKQLRYVTNVKGEAAYKVALAELAPHLEDWDVTPVNNLNLGR